MPVIVVTRMKVRRRHLPAFLWTSLRAAHQAATSNGFRGGRVLFGSDLGFWTLTTWSDGRDAVRFRDSDFHASVMPRMSTWAVESVFAIWKVDDHTLPGWDEMVTRLAAHPNFGELDHPSPTHRDLLAPGRPRYGAAVPVPVLTRVRRGAY